MTLAALGEKWRAVRRRVNHEKEDGMRYLSVCSGIEAVTVAWKPLGWEPVAFSEVAPFPSAVLAHRFPSIPNLGDFTKVSDERLGELRPVHLLVGGTPCQSFSVAGLRQGMADPRGNLALAFLSLAFALRPQWVVWENVPGVLSSNGGRDFGSFVGALGECGYGWAYRVLDAQYFGVAQRRRRVFVVGCLGDQRSASEVLFEPYGVRRHFAPSREAGTQVAGCLEARAGGGGFDPGAHGAASGHLVPAWPAEVAATLQACYATKWGLEDQHALGGASLFVPGTVAGVIPFDTTQITSGTNRAHPKAGDPCHPLQATAHPAAVAFDWQSGGDVRHNVSGDHTSALQANQVPAVAHAVCLGSDPISATEMALPSTTRNGDPGVVQYGTAVRRITPIEAARLQGFPDEWTCVPYRGKPAEQCPDGPQYHAYGNSMAVPVVRWIGERIQACEPYARE